MILTSDFLPKFESSNKQESACSERLPRTENHKLNEKSG